MKIVIVAAISDNLAIGYKGRLPWQGELPADLERFKKLTIGHPVIMGRKTHESIGRPLPSRDNIVITSQEPYHLGCCFNVTSLNNAILLAKGLTDIKAFIIGGARVFQEAIALADEMELTYVRDYFQGDVFFPQFDHYQWETESKGSFKKDDRNKYAYSFVTFRRRK